MRFFHLADLHIGKQMNGYSLGEDQAFILNRVTGLAKERKPDAVLLAGDVFDKTVPSAEAYTLLDDFLGTLTQACPECRVLMIAGNHDSPERLSYASGFLKRHGIHISTMPPGKPEEHLLCTTLTDEYGPVHFWFLPYTRPGYVRELLGEAGLSCEESIRRLLAREAVDFSQRNVLLAHQFVTGGSREDARDPELCDSETAIPQVGGADRVHMSVFDGFDYVALGHIHGPQKLGRDTVRYSGSMLKYSVSEAGQSKTVTEVDLGPKGKTELTFLPLEPLREVRALEGTLEEILGLGSRYAHDYVSITLTDREELFAPRDALERVYDHILELKIARYEEMASRLAGETHSLMTDPMDVFSAFYRDVTGEEPQEEETELMREILSELSAGREGGEL